MVRRSSKHDDEDLLAGETDPVCTIHGNLNKTDNKQVMYLSMQRAKFFTPETFIMHDSQVDVDEGAEVTLVLRHP